MKFIATKTPFVRTWVFVKRTKSEARRYPDRKVVGEFIFGGGDSGKKSIRVLEVARIICANKITL